MTTSIQYDLLLGQVVARVFAHELATRSRPVACFSWVTSGLVGFGQRELVLTLVRSSASRLEQASPRAMMSIRPTRRHAPPARGRSTPPAGN